jgi:hypothetical protein
MEKRENTLLTKPEKLNAHSEKYPLTLDRVLPR